MNSAADKPMRVTLVAENYNPRGGGAERSLHQIAGHLAERGHRVTLLVGRCAAEVSGEVEGVELVCFKGPTLRRARGLRKFAGWADMHLAAAEARGQCDVSLSITTAVAATVLQPRSGTVRETLARNVALRRAATARLAKRLLLALTRKHRVQLALEARTLRHPRLRRVAAVSRYVARQLETHYHFDPARITVIPNAADMPQLDAAARARARTQLWQTFNVPADAVVYLFAALNPRLKGYEPLLYALQRVRARGVPAVLLAVGRNSYAQHKLATALGVRAQVRFVGSSAHMAELYAAADVTVLPTYYDPASKVVIESLMLGTPAISTRYNGASDLIVPPGHAARGLVVDEPGDVAGLAEAMVTLADAERRGRCAAACTGLAEELSMARHVTRLEELLRGECIAQQR